ncbi:DUF4164 family protein [Propylenella binzhouense]|uniref:DUF4164 family protein n=1 Tax=Propylenella binzhouense TaxID=2555902 RepID=A0A964WTL1_9HYPH|nr:DUF4164 family protein [Propylenella binzhouense]MYZ48109.1 DUF4164 family protein [Propylenella binzhouense]
MSNSGERAIARLDRALQEVELLIGRRDAERAQAERMASEVQSLGVDRARLAESLDRATGKIERLEHVNREVSRRLVTAMETIRRVLQARDEGL